MNIKRAYDELDSQKFQLFEDGYAFDMVMIDTDGMPHHASIGDGQQMSLMCLISLCDLFRTAGNGNIEDFAESVKRQLIRFNNEMYDGFIQQNPKS